MNAAATIFAIAVLLVFGAASLPALCAGIVASRESQSRTDTQRAYRIKSN